MGRSHDKHRRTLLRAFDWQAKHSRSVLVEELDEDRAGAIQRREREEFILLIPQIGDVGPMWNYFVWEAFIGVMAVARYRALGSEGLGDDECARVMYRTYEEVAGSVPDRIASFMRYATHSRPVRMYMRLQARLSKRRSHPDFFVFDYVSADAEHDWGLDFHECAIQKFCAQVGETDCLPMICTVDYPFGQRLGWGLRRDQTISAGHDVCTFRFSRSRDTPEAILPRSHTPLPTSHTPLLRSHTPR